MEVGASFGLWIKKRRKALDLTQVALATLVGCSTATIEKIEADERRPSVQMATLLAKALEIPDLEREDFLKVARGKLIVDRLAGVSFTSWRPRQSNLPSMPTPLIGRQPELVEISKLLDDSECRMLSLVGPGGIGKTRLAIQAAIMNQSKFPDGAFFVHLVGVNSADFIAPAVADALGITFSGPTPPITQVLAFLSDKQLLLVLDNYEHLLKSLDLVIDILNEASKVKLLITSREPLGIQWEWLFEVQGLPVPRRVTANVETNSAVNLFIQSIRRLALDQPLGDKELAAIVDICRLVSGMPLGIELAASWSRVLSFQDIATEIRRNMEFLAASMQGFPERHRSLRAVFDHSWMLLGEEERNTLQRLSVFRGGFTRSAAEYVTGASLVSLASLVTKSLVGRTDVDRYEIHEAIRQFAESHLSTNPERWSILDRHSEYYLGMLRDQEQPLKSSAQREVLRALTGEFDNIRGAWSWAIKQQRFELIHQALRCLGWLCDIVGLLQEGIDQIESVVQALKPTAAENPTYMGTLGLARTQQGTLTFRQGYFNRAVALYDEALTWLRPLEDPGLLADVLVWSGTLINLYGDISESRSRLSEGLACAQSVNNLWLVAYATFGLGFVASLTGQYKAGYEQMLTGLEMWRDLGDPSFIAIGLNFITPTAVSLGYLTEAKDFSQESLERTTEVGDRWGMGTAYRNLGQIALVKGDLDLARMMLNKCLSIFYEVVTGWDIVLALDFSGQLSLATGEWEDAKDTFLESLRLALEVQTLPLAMSVLVGVGQLHEQESAFEAAYLLASFVLQNPASTQETKDRAGLLAESVKRQLSAGRIELVEERAISLSFDDLVESILNGEFNKILASAF